MLIICRLLLIVVMAISPLMNEWAMAGHRVDLRDRLDATTVKNMSDRDMEIVAYSQHPGLEKWSHWKVKMQHPDTRDYLACYNNISATNCRTFTTYADYLSFRIHEFYETDRHHFFHHSGHQGTYDGSAYRQDPATIQPHYH